MCIFKNKHMKIIIKNDSKETVKNPNVKIIETTEASFANQTIFIEENDVPIIKFTDTESMYFVKDLDNLYDRKSRSEVLLNITIDNLEAIGNGNSKPVNSRPYKVYTALLSQSGTDAPVATVLENTTGLNITYQYLLVGKYAIKLNSPIPKQQVTIEMSNFRYGSTLEDKGICFLEMVDDVANVGTYQLQTKFRTNTAATLSFTNNALLNNKIEIRVYN